MKFCLIPPRAHVELSAEGEMLFCLGQQYIRDDRYRQWFLAQREADPTRHIILDNGVGDHGDTIDQDMLIEIAKELRPTEVIALDVLFDKDRTIANFEEFVEKYENAGLKKLGVRLFFCPQGKDLYDWLDCYSYGLANEYVSTIGFSKLAIPHVFGEGKDDQGIATSRQKMYNLLMKLNAIKKPIHLLGAGEFTEFSHYKRNSLIRSSDSCFAAWSAMNGQQWKRLSVNKRIPTPSDYFDQTMTFEETVIARENFGLLKKLYS